MHFRSDDNAHRFLLGARSIAARAHTKRIKLQSVATSTKWLLCPCLKLAHWFSGRLSAPMRGWCATSQTQSGWFWTGSRRHGPGARSLPSASAFWQAITQSDEGVSFEFSCAPAVCWVAQPKSKKETANESTAQRRKMQSPIYFTFRVLLASFLPLLKLPLDGLEHYK